MSKCTALTVRQQPCANRVKYLIDGDGSCGIQAHITQVQRRRGVTHAPLPYLEQEQDPTKPLAPLVSPLVPARVVVPGLRATTTTAPLPVVPEKRRARQRTARSRAVKMPRFVRSRHHEYRIIKKLGAGAYGTVHEVEQTTTKQRFAIKQQASRDECSTFSMPSLVEADVMTRCRHPHIIALREVFFDLGSAGTTINYVMEKADVQLRAFPLRNVATIRHILFQLLSALRFLHAHQVIHADIKPENILLVREPEPAAGADADADAAIPLTVKLSDFGLSQYDLHQAKSLHIQTYWYRAPEVFEQNRCYTTAVDMWSLGFIMYELLTGAPMCRANEAQYLTTICELLEIKREGGRGGPANVQAKLDQVSWMPDRRTTLGFDTADWDAYIALMNQCFTYNHEERITADEALQSPLFRGRPAVDGHYRYVDAPFRATPTLAPYYRLITEYVEDNHRYNYATLILALDIFERAYPRLIEDTPPDTPTRPLAGLSLVATPPRITGPGSDGLGGSPGGDPLPCRTAPELAAAALDIALKINQRCALPLAVYKKLVRRDYTAHDVWRVTVDVCQELDFNLYRENIAVFCNDLPLSQVYPVFAQACRDQADLHDFATLSARFLSPVE